MTHSRYSLCELVALRIFDSLWGVPPRPPASLRSRSFYIRLDRLRPVAQTNSIYTLRRNTCDGFFVFYALPLLFPLPRILFRQTAPRVIGVDVPHRYLYRMLRPTQCGAKAEIEGSATGESSECAPRTLLGGDNERSPWRCLAEMTEIAKDARSSRA